MSIADEIKARLDIVDFISETVNLRKAGKSYTGFCPFHQNTRTPSFVVFPDSQSWRCFGACADGGDIFSFVMKRDGLDFRETLEELAKRAGVPLEPPSSQSTVQEQQRQKLLELMAAAATYFHQQLTSTKAGARVREYLTQRQLTAETIATFQLGYALDDWDALKLHFLNRGYAAEELLATGLLVERSDSSPGYDRFRNRLIIPIRDLQGRVIGFGARALAADQLPKYLNSPQTPLFDKSATLYGLDLARSAIRQADQVVIVEGYMDVIQAYQRGARNVVAQMGTALTEAQLKILKRMTGNFVLALDADSAGNAATLRGLNLAREALDRETVPIPTARGLIRYESRLEANIRIAALPAGKDPDDILKEGLEAWQRIIDQAMPVVDFYFQAVTADLDLTSAKGKSVAVQELMPVLRELSNSVEREHYVQKLARLIHVDERTLIAELQQTKKRASRSLRGQAVEPTPDLSKIRVKAPVDALPVADNVETNLEEYCLSLILTYPATLAATNDTLEGQTLQPVDSDDFQRGDHKAIFKCLALWTASETPKIEVLTEMVGTELEGRLATLASRWHQRPPTPFDHAVRDLGNAILRLRLRKTDRQIEELHFILREAEGNQSADSVREYTEMVETHKQRRAKLEQVRDILSLSGKRRAESKILL